MFAKLLSILLIAAILACPFRCQQEVAASTEQVEQTACCEHCAARQPAPPEQPSPTPDNPVDGPCDDCQCVCDGAIFKNSSQYELLLQFAFAVELHSGLQMAVAADALCFDARGTPDRSPEDRLIVTGRDIRCLHMSLLC